VITILCGGSRGDVQPYLALAIALKKLGKEVRIASSQNHASLAQSYEIDFYPTSADFDSLNVDPDMIRQAQQADNPLKMFFSFQKMKKYGIHMVDQSYAACADSELIVYHPGISIGYFAAKKMGVPSVLASPFPLHRTRQRPAVILYGKIKPNPLVNLLSYAMLQKMLWMTAESSLKPFWKEKFGTLPQPFGSPFERHQDARHPAVVSCSNYVFERPSDWNEHIHQHGYWYLDRQDDYTPPKALADFLDHAEKPIYIGFGSMFNPAESERVLKIILPALARLGKRAVVNGLATDLPTPDTVCVVNNIPHTWLFPRVAAVCHHGGAGTSAEGFRAGVPSVILPFALDQHAWAQRAYELGVGAQPVAYKQLTAKKLADAITFVLQDQILTNAKTLAQKIASETGADDCASVIADCSGR
jgi:sterol 3beta-glucosyltransferase